MFKDLMKAAHWPHFVQPETRSSCLNAYRQLLREAHRFPDPFIGQRIVTLARQDFLAYKYVTDKRRIFALIELAHSDTAIIRQANLKKTKSVRKVLDRTLTTINTRETPLKKYLIGLNKTCDHKSLIFRLNNLQRPSISSFVQLNEAIKNAETDYFRFWKFLKTHNLKGLDDRKIELSPIPVYTVLGDVVSPKRQRNTIKNRLNQLLRDAPRPVDRSVLEFLHSRQRNMDIPRFVRRRMLECMSDYYSIEITEHRNWSIIRTI